MKLSDIFDYGCVVYYGENDGYVITWKDGYAFRVFTRGVQSGDIVSLISFYKQVDGWKNANQAALAWVKAKRNDKTASGNWDDTSTTSDSM